MMKLDVPSLKTHLEHGTAPCVRACSLDKAVLHVDVSMERLVIIDNTSTFDQEPLALFRQTQGKKAPIKNLSQQKRATLAVTLN